MERVLEPSTTPHAASEARQNGALNNHPVTTRPTILSAALSLLSAPNRPKRFGAPATVSTSADLLRGHEALY
jgi:hypothetical protein